MPPVVDDSNLKASIARFEKSETKTRNDTGAARDLPDDATQSLSEEIEAVHWGGASQDPYLQDESDGDNESFDEDQPYLEEVPGSSALRLKRRRKPTQKAKESSVYEASRMRRPRISPDKDKDQAASAKRLRQRARQSPRESPRDSPRQSPRPSSREVEAHVSTGRPDHGPLDRAPWRDDSLPKEKLRAYRDPTGRVRVMDFKGRLYKTVHLHKGIEIMAPRPDAPQGARQAAVIEHKDDIADTPEKKGRTATPSPRIQNAPEEFVPEVNTSSLLKRKRQDPVKVGNAAEHALYKAMFQTPREPGKRRPKAEFSRTLDILQSVRDSSASDSEFAPPDVDSASSSHGSMPEDAVMKSAVADSKADESTASETIDTTTKDEHAAQGSATELPAKGATADSTAVKQKDLVLVAGEGRKEKKRVSAGRRARNIGSKVAKLPASKPRGQRPVAKVTTTSATTFKIILPARPKTTAGSKAKSEANSTAADASTQKLPRSLDSAAVEVNASNNLRAAKAPGAQDAVDKPAAKASVTENVTKPQAGTKNIAATASKGSANTSAKLDSDERAKTNAVAGGTSHAVRQTLDHAGAVGSSVKPSSPDRTSPGAAPQRTNGQVADAAPQRNPGVVGVPRAEPEAKSTAQTAAAGNEAAKAKSTAQAAAAGNEAAKAKPTAQAAAAGNQTAKGERTTGPSASDHTLEKSSAGISTGIVPTEIVTTVQAKAST